MKSSLFLFCALSKWWYGNAFTSYSVLHLLTRHSLYPSRSLALAQSSSSSSSRSRSSSSSRSSVYPLYSLYPLYVSGSIYSQPIVGSRSISSELRAKKTSTSSSTSSSASASASGKGQRQKSLAPHYSPKTANQKVYWKYLNDPDISIVLGTGPAGTGKTLFACNTAIQLLKRGDIQKIVLTRPIVSVEEELGFLPGNLVMKMDPWTRPIFDILLEFYSQKDVDAMIQSGVIEISPLAYMRGRTFKRAFIIADEMQNSSPNQMMMLTTRIGEGSKMVITGDLKQSDRSADNGLLDFMNKLRGFRASNPERANELRIRSAEMSMEDVERSAVVKQVLALYETPAHRVIATSIVDPAISETISSRLDASYHFVSVSEEPSDEPPIGLSEEPDIGLSEEPDIGLSEEPQIGLSEEPDIGLSEEPPAKPYSDSAFDAALIPKKDLSKHMSSTEDYHHYSARKWAGW